MPNGERFSDCWPVLRKYFGTSRPAMTMISAGLLDPRMQIEIEVTVRVRVVREPHVEHGQLGADTRRRLHLPPFVTG